MKLPNFIASALRTVVGKSFASDWLRAADLDGALSVPGLNLPFKNSVWVQSAIKKVIGPIQSVPLKFYVDRRGGQPLKDVALEAFWQNPARGAGGDLALSDVIEASGSWLKLNGEFFWIIPEDWFTSRFSTKRSPMLVARPDRMRHVVQGGELIGWVYTDHAGKQFPLTVEQVIQGKLWNPYCEFRGLGEYESARIASEADYLSGKFALNLARNNGNRGEYVIAKGGMPTDEQREQIVRMLTEKRRKALRGEFAPAFLTGDISIEEPSIKSPDAAFIASRLENRHEIYIAFGVPPSMADVVASYSVGSASDRYLLIEETCMPLAAKICEQIEKVSSLFLTKRSTIYAAFDFSQHTVLQQVRVEKIKSAKELYEKGMPMDVISEYLGLGFPKFPGSDKSYLSWHVVEYGADANVPANNPAASDTAKKESDPFDAILRALENGCPVHRAELALAGKTDTSTPQKPERVALAQRHLQSRGPVIKLYAAKFNKVLMRARSQTLSNIASMGQEKTILTKSAAADLIFDLLEFTTQLFAEMRNAGRAALTTSAEQALAELAYDDPFLYPPEEVLAFLQERENKLSGVPQNVFDQVITQLDEGLNAGDSIDDLSKRVRGVFNDLSTAEAKRIAMTETSAAYGVGRQKAMSTAGVQFKQWLTSGLENVRPSHLAAESQTVGIDEPFVVAGEDLMHPGDPKGSAGNVINCHCVSIAVAKPV